MTTVARVVAGVQLLVAARAAVASLRAISRLRGYEPATKKAAQYTDRAAQELWRTRTTQAAGLGAVVASLAGAAWFALFGSSSSGSTVPSAAAAAGLAVASFAARAHVSGHWRDKWQIPGVHDFSEAVKDSKRLALQLGYLGVGWVVVASALSIASLMSS